MKQYLIFNSILDTHTHPYRDALAFPCIQHVDETGYATLGKG